MADASMTEPGQDMSPSPPTPPANDALLYAGYTRFELELEFVTALASPLYLNHLATLKLLQQPDFVAYLSYLRYWTRPEYIKYLSYPGPTLQSLELLQEERFRSDILSPELVGRMMKEGVEAGLKSNLLSWTDDLENVCDLAQVAELALRRAPLWHLQIEIKV